MRGKQEDRILEFGPDMPARIVVASGKPLALSALTWLAERTFIGARVKEVGNSEELAPALANGAFAVAILFHSSPRSLWTTLAPFFRGRAARARLVWLVENADGQAVRLNRAARGSTILDLETESLAAICARIRRSAAGHDFVSQSIRSAEARSGLDAELILTPMQERVLGVIGTGLDDSEAAEVLKVQPATVMTHRSNIMRKLGVRHRGDLIRTAIRLGFVVINSAGELCAAQSGADNLSAPRLSPLDSDSPCRAALQNFH